MHRFPQTSRREQKRELGTNQRPKTRSQVSTSMCHTHIQPSPYAQTASAHKQSSPELTLGVATEQSA